MKNQTLTVLFLSVCLYCHAQVTAPEIVSWIQTPGQTGYSGLAANVQAVNYTATDVYVTCTCIPGYDIGPWTGNPNTPANQNFCFKITRTPAENTGTKTNTGLGHVGVWTNGVSIFNSLDAFSYNNQNVWHQDAYPNEGISFDDCLGHPAPNGEYHHHVNPTCLYNDQASTVHSSILGYAFDGFPIYGAYAYSDPTQPSSIVRMTTSYQLRNITTRTTLPNGSAASSAGPAVSVQYPLGKYIEDYEFVQGLGSLDPFNGRFCVTPEYPTGTYAYFVTIDANQAPVYPYTVGAQYYGIVPSGNTGPQSGHNTVPGGATTYAPVVSGTEELNDVQVSVYPNPFAESLEFRMLNNELKQPNSLQVFDVMGKCVFNSIITTQQSTITTSNWLSGIYHLRVTNADGKVFQQKLVKHQ